MKCEICGRGPAEGVSIFRQNAYGEPGIWRCKACNEQPIDPEVKEIVEIIEGADRETPR